MTRKDYILIAQALRIPYNSFSRNPLYGRELNGVGSSAIALADALEQDNPHFDRDHFLAVVRGEKDINSRPAKCKHVPHNPDVMQTVCEKCGQELDLR